MSTDEKPAESPNPAAPAAGAEAPSAAKKPSAIGGLLKMLVPAILAAGAAYGGTRGAAHASVAAVHAEPAHPEVKPPGPTLNLEPFLVTIFDANRKAHPMKMSIAVEFDAHTKEDLKTFVPRIRDAVIGHLRTLSHEQATDPAQVEKLRHDLTERCKGAGAASAERILVTDFVVQ